MEDYKCTSCGNDSLFYQERAVKELRVMNQKTGKSYVQYKGVSEDIIFSLPLICYQCDIALEVTGDES